MKISGLDTNCLGAMFHSPVLSSLVLITDGAVQVIGCEDLIALNGLGAMGWGMTGVEARFVFEVVCSQFLEPETAFEGTKSAFETSEASCACCGTVARAAILDVFAKMFGAEKDCLGAAIHIPVLCSATSITIGACQVIDPPDLSDTVSLVAITWEAADDIARILFEVLCSQSLELRAAFEGTKSSFDTNDTSGDC